MQKMTVPLLSIEGEGAIAKAKGKCKGRKRVMTAEQIDKVRSPPALGARSD